MKTDVTNTIQRLHGHDPGHNLIEYAWVTLIAFGSVGAMQSGISKLSAIGSKLTSAAG